MFLFYRVVFELAVKLKLWGRVSRAGDQLLKRKLGLPARYYRLTGYAHSRAKRHGKAEDLLLEAMSREPEILENKLIYFKVLVRAGKKELAVNLCRELLAQHPDSWAVICELAQILKSQGRRLQLVKTLEFMETVRPLGLKQRFMLAEAYEGMQSYEAAAQAFAGHASSLSPTWKDFLLAKLTIILPPVLGRFGSNSFKKYVARIRKRVLVNNPLISLSESWFRAGANAERAGDLGQAGRFYCKAVDSSLDREVRSLGIGVMHQRRGDWFLAQAAYQRDLSSKADTAELHERIGITFERAFDWQAAASEFRSSIDKMPNGRRYRRLGFAYERLGGDRVQQCEEAYLSALEYTDVSRRDVLFDLGRALLGVGDTHRACEYFSQMLPTPGEADLWTELNEESLRNILAKDVRDWKTWSDLGVRLFVAQRYENAADAFYQAVYRTDNHNGRLYFYLALSLYNSGEEVRAADYFRQVRRNGSAYSVIGQSYRTSARVRKHGIYAEYYENLSLKKNWILYESYGGAGMSCNPYAMFLAALGDKRFSNFKHVWVIDDLEKVPSDFWGLENVFYVRKESDLYLRFLNACEYLINNSTFPHYFIRKDGQKYLNTWHGTPLKSLGMDIKDSPFQRSNTARNFLQASHLISPNRHTSTVLIDRYGLVGTIKAKVLESGYPRIDTLLKSTEKEKEVLLKRMGLTESKPIVLYAPTYRGLFDSPLIETEKLIADVKSLISDDYQLVFRGHYFAEKSLSELNLPVVIAPHSIDSCNVLSVVDILITDYSSIFYDYLPSLKPVIHYVYDFDEYAENRGMYFGKEGFPGTLCSEVEEVKREIANYARGGFVPDSKYLEIKSKMNPYEDGAATARAIEFFFFDYYDEEHLYPVSDRRSLLFYGSPFDGNGITSACRDLLNSIDKSKFSVTLIVNRSSLIEDDSRSQRMADLEGVEVIVRSGRMCNTFEEEWVVQRYPSVCDNVNEEFKAIYSSAYQREFRRLFSEKRFEAVIDFHGYPHFWASLFAFSGQDKKAVYLHNNMWEEYCLRFPYLKALFGIYENFDTLVSVSESVCLENIAQLSTRFEIEPEKFRVVNNKIDSNRILNLASEENESLALEELHGSSGFNFISVGRLSPEKRHDRLIKAFRLLVDRVDEACSLYILGEGVLRPDLSKLIDQLGLADRVHLLGFRDNPFPYIREADCLVLSSDHEGQGLVLLEAMVLGLPCVSTDTPGPRSVLANGGGVLVELNENDLSRGMEAVMRGDFNKAGFDAEAYETDAMNAFYKVLGLDHHVH